MPQPFKGEISKCDYDVRNVHPMLSGHIGLIASLWTGVEICTGNLLLKLLKDESDLVLTIYFRLKSEGARLAAGQAIVEETLDKILMAEYSKLMEKISNTSRQRDMIVHGLWASAKGNPDIVVLVNSRDVLHASPSMLRVFEDDNFAINCAVVQLLVEKIKNAEEKLKETPDSIAAQKELEEGLKGSQNLKHFISDGFIASLKKAATKVSIIEKSARTYTESDFIEIENRIISLRQEIDDFGEKAR